MIKNKAMQIIKPFVLGFGLLASSSLFAQGNDEVEVIQVRDNIYMLVGVGAGNITVQTGDEGVLIIDTQFADTSDKNLTAIRKLSPGVLRYIINTHHHGDHTGGNEQLKAAGSSVSGGNVGGDIQDAGDGAKILAHENVLLRMTATFGQEGGVSSGAWPTSTFFNDHKDLYFNDEGIRIIHQPNAHTDGDSIVYFRQSDVIVTGDVYQTLSYPYIDLGAGGHINGVIDAATNIINLIIPEYGQDGGTLVIPGHGRLSDIGDVINWREMLTIVRDRMQDMVDRGMTLQQVKDARPTRDYDARWSPEGGFVNTESFVEAVYQNLSE